MGIFWYLFNLSCDNRYTSKYQILWRGKLLLLPSLAFPKWRRLLQFQYFSLKKCLSWSVYIPPFQFVVKHKVYTTLLTHLMYWRWLYFGQDINAAEYLFNVVDTTISLFFKSSAYANILNGLIWYLRATNKIFKWKILIIIF